MNVMNVINDYKWLARDKDGLLFLYTDKPSIYEDNPDKWGLESGDAVLINSTEPLLENVTFEKSPLLISDFGV